MLLAATDDLLSPGTAINASALGLLAWFLWYIVTKTVPMLIERVGGLIRSLIEELAAQRKAADSAMERLRADSKEERREMLATVEKAIDKQTRELKGAILSKGSHA